VTYLTRFALVIPFCVGAVQAALITMPPPEVSDCYINHGPPGAIVYEGGASDPLCRGYRSDLGATNRELELMLTGFESRELGEVQGAQMFLVHFPNLQSVEDENHNWWASSIHVSFDRTISIYATVPGTGYGHLDYHYPGVQYSALFGDVYYRAGWELTFVPAFPLGQESLVATLRIFADTLLSGPLGGGSQFDRIGLGEVFPLAYQQVDAPAEVTPIPEPANWGLVALASLVLLCVSWAREMRQQMSGE
jgi:hypothetical protein